MKTCARICLGPEGSFSQVAISAAWYQLEIDRIPFSITNHFVDENEKLIPAFISYSGRAVASLAVHTLAEGRLETSFKKIIGLLGRHENVKIFGAIDMPISFDLLARKGIGQIKGVLAHPQAVGACRQFLDLLNLPIITVGSNSHAAQKVARDNQYREFGALSSERCATLYGLERKHCGCESSIARTISYIFGKGFEAPSIAFGSWRILIVCDIPDKVGSLMKVLSPLAEANVNIVHLQSLYAESGKYRYCIEGNGMGKLTHVKSAIKRISEYSKDVLTFGPFPIVTL